MNVEQDKLCLKWNDYQQNAISAFGTLREDREFSDVTLACEDGQQMEAHKVILASSSPFFHNLLKRNKHQHPLIYIKGLKSKDLVAMIDFVYYGEANVYQENLDSFLAVAEELQLKGLVGQIATKEVEDMIPPARKETPKLLQQRVFPNEEAPDIISIEDEVESCPPLERHVSVTYCTVAADLQDLDDKVNSMMEASEDMDGLRYKRICKVCGKEGNIDRIIDHIEVHHITGVSHTCNTCGKICRTRTWLRKHNCVKNNFQ